jgi:hypothetical protein
MRYLTGMLLNNKCILHASFFYIVTLILKKMKPSA